MSVPAMFSDFVSNLSIGNAETISTRYGELTSALNKQFRDTESKTANTLQVGSFGRKTGIDGISDLDMLYIMPKTKWVDYNKAGGQLSLLQDAKDAILKRYPTTKVKVDRLVVTVTYSNFHVEVQTVFKQDDQSYLYPDTKNGGSWKTTKPRRDGGRGGFGHEEKCEPEASVQDGPGLEEQARRRNGRATAGYVGLQLS